MSVTSNNRGHHHASDFIYASPYELIEKHADPNYGNSDIYVPASVSIRMTPPPLPQRNNNYSPPPRNKDRISSRSSSSTPPVTRAFPKTPSPINNDLKVVIEVHNEDRPSSLKQLQDMLETTNLISTTNSEDILPQEKDGFLSRKVGYEIERRLVKAVQVRTLRKKRQKKGHYHYYPFYEKQNYKGLWDWFKRQFNPNAGQIDHVYNTKRKHRRKRRKHHRFCMKCVTSSFSSLFRVLKEPIIVKTHSELYNDGQKIYNEENVSNLNLNQKNISGINQRAISRTATEATRTPTPKMLLDLKSGAIHWPVYQYGGQSGSGMLLSTKGLVSKKKNATGKIQNSI